MADYIVILTGAGISAESGLGTFRDKDGLWTKYDLSEVATPQGFEADPAKVHAFYNARRENMLKASPNAAHVALARLEAEWPGEVTLITQNVDDLHERAGHRSVIHMHGELAVALCANCNHRWEAPVEMHADDPCPACKAPRTRPDVVWFGEIPFHMELIEDLLSSANLFVAIGTSGQVYPAAGFVELANRVWARTVELSLERTDISAAFDEMIRGPATETVPVWVEGMLSTT